MCLSKRHFSGYRPWVIRMRNFMKVCGGINVEPLNFLLKQKPELWNQRTLRKEIQDSPHLAMSDIWVRYNDEAKMHQPDFHELHYPVWYPVINDLPMIRSLAIGLMTTMGATHLG